MQICLNGRLEKIEDGARLADLLKLFGYDPSAVAVAVNEEFVPRAAYASRSLKEDDQVEVVAPMQGG